MPTPRDVNNMMARVNPHSVTRMEDWKARASNGTSQISALVWMGGTPECAVDLPRVERRQEEMRGKANQWRSPRRWPSLTNDWVYGSTTWDPR
ncbi:hypothetical protein RvY_19041-2 [Ramazzottius varieornatus]|uniref:Uncharacterized protein n=1 Tax=Ramazzottius varieornatus TaxID=947166 RepID=A0A1D1W7Z8_RAMVA|nr:hypothetical protein RvY_19041-2 [Ramazzottius varieornatus]